MTIECSHGENTFCLCKLQAARDCILAHAEEPEFPINEVVMISPRMGRALRLAADISGLSETEVFMALELLNFDRGYVLNTKQRIAVQTFVHEMKTPYIENGRCSLCNIPCKAGAVHMNCPEDKRGQ